MKKFYTAIQSSITLLFCLTTIILNAQPPTISYQSAITGLSAPVDIVNAHDGSNRLFIVQQGGIIKMWNGTVLSNFIDLSSIISSSAERGLLSMVFHPGFNGTSNRYFFVYYTDVSGNVAVSRYQTTLGDPNTGDNTTQTLIITINHPTNNNHNGGKLNFGSDGYLYFATGDGGGGNDGPNNAQTGTVLLGKMLRIDINNSGTVSHPNYAIPADNPYVGTGTIADEVWNLGLRNPFRWSFDRANGNMWIGDVGQDTKEEVDFRPAGSTGHNNFGWRCYEGYISTPSVPDCTPTDNVYPVLSYDNPPAGSSAVTGGYVYRGNEYTTFKGYYVAADVYSGDLYFLWPNGSGGFDSSVQTGLQNFVVGFGEAENGTLYAISQATNTAYKLVASGGVALPVTLSSFTVKHFDDYNQLKWTTSSEENTQRFYIEFSTDRTHFSRVGQVSANRNPNGSNYVFQHVYKTSSSVYYRLAIEDDNASIRYSSILMIAPDDRSGIKIYPSVVHNDLINISLSVAAEKMTMVNSNGVIVFEKSLKNFSGTTAINLPSLPKGMYILQVTTATGVTKEKIIVE